MEPTGLNRWIKVEVVNRTKGPFALKVFEKKSGRFFKYPSDFDTEVDPPEGQIIEKGKSFAFASCGKKGAASGTEWYFSIYGPNGEIALYHWICPWSGLNQFDLEASDNNYILQNKGFDRSSDVALGEGIITVGEF
ncbi:hypothetical protein DFQ29_000449 [Apophysomyces sp. BC1021]|nr:hypothetical protein DFQ29_000449 [Apophysomyces sp. BC1021]